MPKRHTKPSSKVKSRDLPFVEQTETRIWREKPTEHNPYIAESNYCHGYDLLELLKKRSFIDVLYLLFRGELPTTEQSALLEGLMIALINPGPRHPATRAAQLAGVGKTDPAHILPIGLTIYGGTQGGASEIEPSMRFLRKHRTQHPKDVATELLAQTAPPADGDWHIAPGFGSRFGGIDCMPTKIADHLATLTSNNQTLLWGCDFAKALNSHQLGWLTTGIAAAAFTDLGFAPRAGPGLLQLLGAPGLLAHGIELSNKPITAMPFVKDENYVIEYDK